MKRTVEFQIEILRAAFLTTGFRASRVSLRDIEWLSFLNREGTPPFPAGESSLEWRGRPLGDCLEVVQEPSRILEIIRESSGESVAKARRIAEVCWERFHQDAVTAVRELAEVCF